MRPEDMRLPPHRFEVREVESVSGLDAISTTVLVSGVVGAGLVLAWLLLDSQGSPTTRGIKREWSAERGDAYAAEDEALGRRLRGSRSW